MVSPRRFLVVSFGLLTIASWGVVPSSVVASRNDYYDFGPYYQPPVLGLSLSSLENLPALSIPTEIMPAAATGILPDSPLHNFEKVIENAQLAFIFDPVAKEELRLHIAEERLSEAKTLIEQGKVESGAGALSDYRHTMAEVAAHLPGLADKGDVAQSFINKVEETAAAHAVVATSISLVSPPQQAEIWTKAAGVGEDVLDRVAESRGEPAIPEDLSTGIQKLKEEGLISEEESNKLYSFKNRSEVRDELEKLATSGTFPISELSKMDTAFGKHYPEVYGQYQNNLQVVELRTYQGLPQPSADTVKKLEEWAKNPDVSPSNDIKPYLWYNRAQDLAEEVNLSNFSSDQQSDLAKFYPEAVTGNPTYTIPTLTPDQTTSESEESGQNTTPSPSPTTTPDKDIEKAKAYLGETGGVLPGDTTYFFKQFGEQAQYFLTLDPADKAELKMRYAERRLAEARQLAEDPKKASVYESTIQAYKQAMEDTSTQLKQAGDSEKAKDVAKDLENQAARHEAVLEKGLLPIPPNNPGIINDAITATEDAMDRSADVLDRPALPPVLSYRLEDLKAQGLVLAEEVEDLTRSESREEVREKVRKLVGIGSFPPADAKKMDEAQVTATPGDYVQLVEVRKVEELQGLRSVQTEFAQTPTLRNTAANLGQKEAALVATIDPTLINEKDLGGRSDLIQTYQTLVATASARPINVGQFGPDAGNDYDQYKCDGPRQYYSFAAKKCVAYDPAKGFQDDAQPICPVGYNWSWQNQSCQISTGGISLPSPSPEPEPETDEERAARSKSCPDGSSYKAPNGCVWDKDGKSVYDSRQYRCGRGQYYSFEELKCVSSPKEGELYPKDSAPSCKESEEYWSWQEGKCRALETATLYEVKDVEVPKPFFATPGSPLYFLKQAGEYARQTLTFTPQASGEVRLAHAKERLAEAVDALKKSDEKGAKLAIDAYVTAMQGVVADVSREGLSEMAKNEIGQLLGKEVVEQNLILQKVGILAESDGGLNLSAANSATILGVDKAADLKGEDPIPADLRSKIESLPAEMISEEDKKKILEGETRVEARLAVGDLSAKGLITVAETAYLNDEFKKVDPGEQAKIDELKRLVEIATVTKQKADIEEKVEKNEEIVKKLDEFQKTFEVGNEIPADVRPYVRLTRIDEVAQTVRPDVVRLEDFQNRKDLVLAVATLQQEYKPTRQDVSRVEEFRRRNPNAALPLELARVEALAYSLGVREQAGPCFLPSPPFPANTPCPAPGAAIPIASFIGPRPVDEEGYRPGYPGTGWNRLIVDPVGFKGSRDSEGNRLVYGQGPKPSTPGVCQSGYHWMYDSGGWCMANEGSYSGIGSGGTYTPSGYGSGYTPYSPYYTAPGASPATSGYPVGDTSPNDGCPYGSDSDGRGNCIPNSYPASSYGYTPPSYWGAAPTTYTTNPPAGTVPGSGPVPTSPGKCPSGFHWMSDSGGWCMSDGNTYVPSSSNAGYPSGTSGGYSPNLTKSSCGPGYYWDGRGCIATYSGGGGYSGSGSSTPWCWSAFPPPGGWSCGSGSSWDGSTCSCKPSGGTSGSNSSGYSPNLTQSSCGPGYYWDGRGCLSTYSGSSSGWGGSSSSCTSPSSGCGSNNYWDYGTCSCRSSSTYSGGTGSSSSGYSSTSTTTGSSTGSCPSGSHWMTDNGGYCMSDSARDSSSGGSGSTTSGGSSSGGSPSGSCPSGYHWMSDNGGWCMSDGGSGSSTSTPTTTSSEPAPSTSTSTTTEPAPVPSTSSETTTTTTTSSPAP